MEKIIGFTPGPWHAVDYAGYWILQAGPNYGDMDLSDEACPQAKNNTMIAALAPTLYEQHFKMLEALKTVFKNEISTLDENSYRLLKQTIKECEL